jgi:hypothetical protein
MFKQDITGMTICHMMGQQMVTLHSIFMHGVKPIGNIWVKDIDDKAKINALAWYVLNNYNEVGPYVE